jgi:DNA polymerase
MFKQLMILDAETRWANKACDWAPDGYTLSKMTTEEYIRSPLFRAFGFCYKYFGDHNSAKWVSHDDLPSFFDSIDWSITAVACHNAMFDVGILTWVYGKSPCFIFDTLSMARILRGIEVGNSAAKLAQDFGLPPKGTATVSTDGVWMLPPHIEAELATYCAHDVYLCEKFLEGLHALVPGGFPQNEYKLIDATVRMFTEPQLELDTDMLEQALEEENIARTSLLSRLGCEESSLASNEQFADALRQLGEDPPTKISKTTGEETFAFAKNDALFQALINSDKEEVALLCEARLKVKSTQMRTRAQRFLDIGKRGKLPVPVNYGHTRTQRWGAAKGASINMQNLKRGGVLRKAIVAPEGYECVPGDLSQIEPRVLAYLSDYTELLDIFASGKDPYAQFGSQMFGIPGMSKESHPDLRQSAKSALLGAGYGLGWASFATQLLTGFLGAPPVMYDRAFAKQLGVTKEHFVAFMSDSAGADRMQRMAEIPHTCTDEELFVHCVCAKIIIDTYRATSKPVVKFWDYLKEMLETVIAVPGAAPVKYKCLTFEPGKIILPNGLPILYDRIKITVDKFGRNKYTYWNGKKDKNLYHGILAENVTSGTARCVIADGMLRVQSRYRCAMPVHDEGVWVVPTPEVAQAMVWIHKQLTKPVPYMPGLPIGADVGSHRRYGEAK